MLRRLLALLMLVPLYAGAQTIPPAQLTPSSVSGQVICTVTGGSAPQWCSTGGTITPGAQYVLPEYSGAGTTNSLGPSLISSDASGDLNIPATASVNQLNWLSSGVNEWDASSTPSILNFNYVGVSTSSYVNFGSPIQSTYIQGPLGTVHFRPGAGNQDDIIMSIFTPVAGIGASGWLQNTDINGRANIDFNPETSGPVAVPQAQGLVWWLKNSGTLNVLINRPGTGYSGSGTCSLSGGVGSGDTCTAALNGSGGITVSIVGSGTYSVPPALSVSGFTGGSGFQATPYITSANQVLASLFVDPVANQLRFNTGIPSVPGTDLFTVDAGNGNTSVAGGTNIVYRCLTAGTKSDVGTLTINAASCGTSTDSGLRVK